MRSRRHLITRRSELINSISICWGIIHSTRQIDNVSSERKLIVQEWTWDSYNWRRQCSLVASACGTRCLDRHLLSSTHRRKWHTPLHRPRGRGFVPELKIYHAAGTEPWCQWFTCKWFWSLADIIQTESAFWLGVCPATGSFYYIYLSYVYPGITDLTWALWTMASLSPLILPMSTLNMCLLCWSIRVIPNYQGLLF